MDIDCMKQDFEFALIYLLLPECYDYYHLCWALSEALKLNLFRKHQKISVFNLKVI